MSLASESLAVLRGYAACCCREQKPGKIALVYPSRPLFGMELKLFVSLVPQAIRLLRDNPWLSGVQYAR